MCGLVGVMGNIGMSDRKVFNQLMYTAYLRGDQATGVAGISPFTDEAKIFKGPWPALDAMAHPHWDTAASLSREILMGHTRQPTVGANTKWNAQPFAVDGEKHRLIGTHNGTITARSSFIDEYKTFGTDSEALYTHIANNGLPLTIQEAMIREDDRCAYALVFYDRDAKTLNMIKNPERPLCFAYSKDRKMFYWASEAGQLGWILTRNLVQYEKIFMVPDHTLMTWKMRPVAGEYADPTRLKLTPKEEKVSGVTYYPQRTAPTSSTAVARVTGTAVPTTQGVFKHGKLDHSLLSLKDFRQKGEKWKPPYREHGGQIMNKDQALRAWTASTCAICDRVYLAKEEMNDWGKFALFLKPSDIGAPQWLCEDCCANDANVTSVLEMFG